LPGWRGVGSKRYCHLRSRGGASEIAVAAMRARKTSQGNGSKHLRAGFNGRIGLAECYIGRSQDIG